jgi:AraC-like DNA-binding protein
MAQPRTCPPAVPMQPDQWRANRLALPAQLAQAGVSAATFKRTGTGHSYRRREPASSAAVLVFGWRGAWRLHRPHQTLRATHFFAPAAQHAALVESDDIAACIEVSMPAWLAPTFAAPEALGGRIVAVSELGHSARTMCDDLANIDSLAHASERVMQFVTARLSEFLTRTPREIPWAWREIYSAHGSISIAQLAQTLGWSERRLLRQFRAATGLTPKQAARLARFERAQRGLASRASIAEIAALCGYADQSHMTREFSALAGATPAQARNDHSVQVVVGV